MQKVSALHNYDLENKRVFLRADLNIPLYNGVILDDYRLQAILPTLDLILQKKGTIVLATHIGRPKGVDPLLSTKIIVPWFENRGYKIEHISDLETAYQKTMEIKGKILLLENLRFFPGEKADDQTFAQLLASLGDYYVNDAFGTLHRTDSSIFLVPQFFNTTHHTIGLLVEKELKTLSKLIETPQHPFILIIGGGKVHDKLPILKNLLAKTTTILLCPAIVFTFLKALGHEVGKSLVDNSALASCKEFLAYAAQQKVEILFPLDYQIAENTLDGQLNIVEADKMPHNGFGISVGPKTLKLYIEKINKARMIFYNAAMGFPSRPETLQGTSTLLQALAISPAFSVIGGGDSVAAAQKCGIKNSLNTYLSTGGGATLAYLAGERLPGLEALGYYTKKN